MEPQYALPLQLQRTWPRPDDAAAQFLNAHEIGQSSHEAFVHGGEQLEGVIGRAARNAI